MNYLQLCQRLVQETGIADTGPSNTAGQVGDYGRITAWINDAWLRIQSMRSDWGWMWGTGSSSLAASTNTITLPDTVQKIKRLSMGESFLYEEGYEEFANAYLKVTEGVPSAYTVRPDGVILFNAKPVTDETVTYEFYYTPTLLVNNNSVPELPSRYHMLIVYEALRSYSQFDEAPELERKATLYFEQMLADLSRDQVPNINAPVKLA